MMPFFATKNMYSSTKLQIFENDYQHFLQMVSGKAKSRETGISRFYARDVNVVLDIKGHVNPKNAILETT